MIRREVENVVRRRLQRSPAVALLGPRQIGKTTLARDLAEGTSGDSVYLDLERPDDLRRLDDADAFLRAQAGKLVVLDEVHRKPDLFPVLRGVIDENRRNGITAGQFLLLGSASLDLVKSADESLAGRISHIDMGGVAVDEAAAAGIGSSDLWLRGGFPDSLTAVDDEASFDWRADLIRTYLERDIPFFAPRVPSVALRRLWVMLAHRSGSVLNRSSLGQNLDVSVPTVDRYIDLLVDLGLLRRLQPWFVNVKKRVVKSPKVYVRDTGLLHALLEVEDHHELAGHPAVGGSFESFVVESVVQVLPRKFRPYFYRTSNGTELDLVLVRSQTPVAAIEIKRSAAASVSKGFYSATDDLGIATRFMVHADNGGEPFESNGVTVLGITDLVARIRSMV